jgi:hypothetical protein
MSSLIVVEKDNYVERRYVTTRSNSEDAWTAATEYVKVARRLGLLRAGWRIGVRHVARNCYLVEAVRRNSDDTQK